MIDHFTTLCMKGLKGLLVGIISKLMNWIASNHYIFHNHLSLLSFVYWKVIHSYLPLQSIVFRSLKTYSKVIPTNIDILLSANFTKCSNKVRQFIGNLPTNCLSVFGHFVGLSLKGLKIDTGINCKNSYFFLCSLDLSNSWLKIDSITSEYRRSQILCTIKKALTWNRKSATEGVP